MRRTVGILLVASFLSLVGRVGDSSACAFAYKAQPSCAAETISLVPHQPLPDFFAGNTTQALLATRHARLRARIARAHRRATKPATDGAPGTWMKALGRFIPNLFAQRDD